MGELSEDQKKLIKLAAQDMALADRVEQWRDEELRRSGRGRRARHMTDDEAKQFIVDYLRERDNWVNRNDLRKYLGYHRVDTDRFYRIMEDLVFVTQSRGIGGLVQYRYIDASGDSCPLCGRHADSAKFAVPPDWHEESALGDLVDPPE